MEMKFIKNEKSVSEINIGTLGHVDSGKTTLVQSLSGKWTATHSEEIKRGITIRIGYAEATFYKCKKCESPFCYGSSKKCKICSSECDILRTVSFIDAPGHESLLATILSGAASMDGVLFLIPANEQIGKQSREYLIAAKIVGIKNFVFVQSKIDLVDKNLAKNNYNKIKSLMIEILEKEYPIVPISAENSINIDSLIQIMETQIKTPTRDIKKNPKMFIMRSFDINKPGSNIKDLKGGVIGGSLICGKLKIGDEIQIRPGVKRKNSWIQLTTKIIGLKKSGFNVDEVGPGGLISIKTELDPSLTKSDNLSGSVIGFPGTLPDNSFNIRLRVHLLEKTNIEKKQRLVLIIGTTKTLGIVVHTKKNEMEMKLQLPICVFKEDKVSIMQRNIDKWNLIGWGEILS